MLHRSGQTVTDAPQTARLCWNTSIAAALVERAEGRDNSKPPMLPGAIYKMLKPARETIEDENE